MPYILKPIPFNIGQGAAGGGAVAEEWIPTLDGTTADTDGVTRTQSTSGGGDGYWTTSDTGVFTLDTGSTQLLGDKTSNTGEQSIYTKMPFVVSLDGFTLDWTVVLASGNENNTNVFLTLGSFEAIDYSPTPSEGNEYFEVVANQGNADWHIRSRAYPTGGSLSSVTYGSQGISGQAGGAEASSTNYYRITGTSTTLTVQLFSDSDRSTQVGSDDVLTFDGTQWGLGESIYIGIATDDFKINMAIKDIKLTNE